MIDVIIPAYRGTPQTRRCLESVLRAAVAAPHEIVVVDDASPEPELSAWLRALAKEGRVTLIAHERNAGFVASVNEGMRLHPGRDVVLLNSDTEVADGWLDRLAACAAREPRAGTVTPFSNNATICSYPRSSASNALPAGTGTAQMDAVFARANAGRSVDLPTAVGFCMFIRRACLDEIGPFDEEAFGRGYGEEVDFCLRGARAGWRHLLAADTFVFHEGEVSFGAGAPDIREKAQRVIDERYPEFQPRLADFLEREPVRPLRRAVDLQRLSQAPAVKLLFRADTPGSGQDAPEEVLESSATAQRSTSEALVLDMTATGEDVIELASRSDAEEFEAFFRFPDDWPHLGATLAALGLLGKSNDPGGPIHLPPHVFHRPEGYLPARIGRARVVMQNDASRLRQLAQELHEANKRLHDIESSTSWRLTAPLRFVVDTARRTLRSLFGSSPD